MTMGHVMNGAPGDGLLSGRRRVGFPVWPGNAWVGRQKPTNED